MDKNKLYYIFILLLFVVFVYFESLQPKKTDWSYNFSSSGKMPYGCHVMHNMLSEVFKGATIVDNYDNPYQWTIQGVAENTNTLIIIADNFTPDTLEFKILSKYVNSGGKVFISANWFNKVVRDLLHFKIKIPNLKEVSKKKVVLNFTQPQLRKDGGYILDIGSPVYFTSFDTSKSILLAQDSGIKTVFIKVPYGKGAYYLSTTPLVFSNYILLYNNPEFAFKCFSFINSYFITWDEYFKPKGASIGSSSPLRYILSKPALRNAYFILLFTSLLYIFFEGRRKQRVIPVYSRPENSSLEFIKTLGMLYFNRKKHKNLAEKRIAFFYEYVHTNFYILFDENNPESIKLLAEKSGVNEILITRIYNIIQWIRKQNEIYESELLDFVEVTNLFMNQTKPIKK